MTALEALHAPPDKPAEMAQVVVEAMRQNLLFTRLRSLLTLRKTCATSGVTVSRAVSTPMACWLSRRSQGR